MRKILAVAVNEYRTVVLTKSFLLSLLFPVVVYGGMFVATLLFGDKVDLRDRVLVVADRTGELFPELEAANQKRNRSEAVVKGGRPVGPQFVLQAHAGPEPDNVRQLAAELSGRVRAGEIFAFAVIGADYLAVDGGPEDYLRYYSESPTFSRLPDWLARSAQEAVEQWRFTHSGMDRREINRLISHNQLETFSLAEMDRDGNVTDPREDNLAAAYLIPVGLLVLLFFSIQMTIPVLLSSVIEEKMARIAEVLISCVSPFQLLAGKLLAGVAVGLTFSTVYLLSLSYTLRHFENSAWVPPGTYLWFFAFLLAGMLAFGSLFAGVSAISGDLKDSQNYAGPIIFVLMVPFLLSFIILEAPDGVFAHILSLTPPFSVLAMVVRIAVPPGPPDWQVFLSLGLNLLFALGALWVSSRLFRIGILAQGKAPSPRELVRWIFQRG